MKAVGSAPLGERVAGLSPDVHVFGHTHFGWDAPLDGVRYVQAALGTPRERRVRPRALGVGGVPLLSPIKLWSGDSGGWCAPRSAMWSEYYSSHARRSHVIEPLGGWVRARRTAVAVSSGT